MKKWPVSSISVLLSSLLLALISNDLSSQSFHQLRLLCHLIRATKPELTTKQLSEWPEESLGSERTLMNARAALVGSCYYFPYVFQGACIFHFPRLRWLRCLIAIHFLLVKMKQSGSGYGPTSLWSCMTFDLKKSDGAILETEKRVFSERFSSVL